MKDKKRFYYAIATLVGTIIGVGLFGLPYVGSKSGFLIISIYFILLAALALVIHIFYGEVSFHTEGLHRLPGYTEKYLGEGWKRLTFIIEILSLVGSLLAYLIIGGIFLANLFNGSVYLFTFLFFIFGAWLIWKDNRSVGPIELILLFVMIAIVILIFILGSPSIKFNNLLTINTRNFFIPYGVVMFSLWGASIIPEIKELTKGNYKKLKKVIIYSILTVVLFYFVFTFTIIGVSGSKTTEEAIFGLKDFLGNKIILIGLIFGVITTFTSFISLGLTLKKTFWYDYHLSKYTSWLLACFVPLVMYIAGLHNFIKIISLTGAVALGIQGIIILLIYYMFKKGQKKYSNLKLTKLKYFISVLVLFLCLGVIFEIFYSL